MKIKQSISASIIFVSILSINKSDAHRHQQGHALTRDSFENIHFNFYENKKESFDFSHYPTQQLDGVAEQTSEDLPELNRVAKYD